MARYSDSDSENRKKSSKKSKKKSKTKRRSRSSSYDTGRSRDSRRRSRSDSRRRSYSSERSRRSRSHDERKRRRRSRSDDSYISKRSYRRSRSRTRSPRRRRSNSRTDSRDDGYSYRHRSRSRSRETSYKKKKRSKKRSRDRTPVKKDIKQVIKAKDPCDDIPGFSEMEEASGTPAQQSKLRVQAAFKAAEANTSKASSGRSSPLESAIDQMQKAQVIDDIEDSDFMPTHFSSSRSNKSKETTKLPSWPTNLAEQEDYHEMAIFGNSSTLGLDEQTKKEINSASEPTIKRTINWEKRDLKTLAHPNLHISIEEAERRWMDKLNSMRREKLNSIAT